MIDFHTRDKHSHAVVEKVSNRFQKVTLAPNASNIDIDIAIDSMQDIEDTKVILKALLAKVPN